ATGVHLHLDVAAVLFVFRSQNAEQSPEAPARLYRQFVDSRVAAARTARGDPLRGPGRNHDRRPADRAKGVPGSHAYAQRWPLLSHQGFALANARIGIQRREAWHAASSGQIADGVSLGQQRGPTLGIEALFGSAVHTFDGAIDIQMIERR